MAEETYWKENSISAVFDFIVPNVDFIDIKPNIIESGVRKRGIFPFNKKVIAEEKFDPAALKRYKILHPEEFSNDNLSEHQLESFIDQIESELS